MSDFASSNNIPKWRIAFWGTLAVGAFAWIAYALGDQGILWAGVIGVPVLITLMTIVRLARTQWARQNLGLLFLIYAILQTAMLIWRFLER